MITPVLWHVCESSVFALILWGTASAIKNQAAVRHRLWVAAILKFALPISWFRALGAAMGEHFAVAPLRVPVLYGVAVASTNSPIVSIREISPVSIVCMICWIGMSAFLLIVWLRRFGRGIGQTVAAAPGEEAALRRCARRIQLQRVPCLRVVSQLMEPYVGGTLRPFVVVPQGLYEQLGAEPFEAVLMHELAHVKRKDNWWAVAVHAVVCLFPWYPPLWWMEHRVRGEAELACDALVLKAGASREAYLSGLMEVCRMSLLEPAEGSGLMSGVNLKNRLERIMSNRVEVKTPRVLGQLGGALLAGCCGLAFVLGVVGSRRGMAQEPTSPSVASASVTGCEAGRSQPFAVGTVVRHINNRILQVCVVQENRPLWLTLAPDHLPSGVKVVDLADPLPPSALSCRETAPHGKLCTCDDLDFSPGAVVDSPRGKLACPASGGQWQLFKGMQTPWPPAPRHGND